MRPSPLSGIKRKGNCNKRTFHIAVNIEIHVGKICHPAECFNNYNLFFSSADLDESDRPESYFSPPKRFQTGSSSPIRISSVQHPLIHQ